MGYSEHKNINNGTKHINGWKPRFREFIDAINEYLEENQKPLALKDYMKFSNMPRSDIKKMFNLGDLVYKPLQKSKNKDSKFRKGEVRYYPQKYKIGQVLFNPFWRQERYIIVPENAPDDYDKKYNNVSYQRSELLKTT